MLQFRGAKACLQIGLLPGCSEVMLKADSDASMTLPDCS